LKDFKNQIEGVWASRHKTYRGKLKMRFTNTSQTAHNIKTVLPSY
jgi:hypothetical protein